MPVDDGLDVAPHPGHKRLRVGPILEQHAQQHGQHDGYALIRGRLEFGLREFVPSHARPIGTATIQGEMVPGRSRRLARAYSCKMYFLCAEHAL